MKILSSTLITAFIFTLTVAVAPPSSVGTFLSRRTLRTLTIREHWRMRPYRGFQGLQKAHPVVQP